LGPHDSVVERLDRDGRHSTERGLAAYRDLCFGRVVPSRLKVLCQQCGHTEITAKTWRHPRTRFSASTVLTELIFLHIRIKYICQMFGTASAAKEEPHGAWEQD
jgi:hypothetical protein